MRAHGVVATASGLGGDDHLCWVYDDAVDLGVAARRFLADGLARGARLFCVGDAAIAAVRAGGEPLADVDALVERGALVLLPVGGAYLADGGLDPDEQLAFYDAATRAALADGYRGLRVVADLTELAADDGARAGLVRWEHLADDFMASGSGMSALCAYRRDAVDHEVLAEVAAVHPLLHADDVEGFRLFFGERRMTLAGTVDVFGAERLARRLAETHVTGPVVTLDVARVEFVDARGATVLARWAAASRERGARVHVTGATPLFLRVWTVLGFDALADVSLGGT